MSNKVYKILTKEEWKQFEENGVFHGSNFDKNDGFIHLATKKQALGVIDRYFQGIRPLYLTEFTTDSFGEDLKWEEATGGELFPHLYSRSLKKEEMTNVDIKE